jgi:hypothetical protein
MFCVKEFLNRMSPIEVDSLSPTTVALHILLVISKRGTDWPLNPRILYKYHHMVSNRYIRLHLQMSYRQS